MAFPGIKKTQGYDFNYFQALTVDWNQFGADDGYTVADGYGPDLIIKFSTQGLIFNNDGYGTIEYSFNGNTVHGEITAVGTARAFLQFNNRVACLIWFRVKSGSIASAISVEAWGTR